ncbi:MAG: hypothetical protein KBT11_03685, partial [Treponema sp.]|nr:hypothetical protein [Candidatus Treponema equifaecale]
SDLINEFIEKPVADSIVTLLSTSDSAEITKCAGILASQFGTGFDISTQENAIKLVQSFKKNLTLLIQKTWVEQSDIMLKEEIIVKLEKICNAVSEGKWAENFVPFIQILNSVISLMFGPISKTAEFDEYALRIDPEFGVFCWYVKNLPASNDWSNEKNMAVILIAMFFLANY